MTKKIVHSIYLMLLFPALTLILGLKDRSFRYRRFLLILFITFFGSTIIYNEGHDAFVHRQNVIEHYQDLGFSQFLYELQAILNFAPIFGTNDDVYIHVLSYFVGSILKMPQLFFVFVAFIYAYFFSGSVLKVLQIIPQTKLSFIFYAFAVIFLAQKNLEGINTVRTWTGLWVLFYAAYSYFETKKFKYLFLMLLPPFIHIAYFVMAVPAWIVAIFGNKFKWVYLGIFFISFFYEINQNVAMENLAQTDVGESKSKGYYVDSEDASDMAQYDSATWYRQLQKLGVQKYALYLVVFVLILGGVYFREMTMIESQLFSIGILTLALSNFSNFLSALAARSSLIGSVFILAALILLIKRGYFSNENTRLKGMYHIVFYISILMFTWLFTDANVSIMEFLQWFL